MRRPTMKKTQRKLHAKRKPKNDITNVCDQLLVPIARDSYIVNDRRCQLRFKEKSGK